MFCSGYWNMAIRSYSTIRVKCIPGNSDGGTHTLKCVTEFVHLSRLLKAHNSFACEIKRIESTEQVRQLEW